MENGATARGCRGAGGSARVSCRDSRPDMHGDWTRSIGDRHRHCPGCVGASAPSGSAYAERKRRATRARPPHMAIRRPASCCAACTGGCCMDRRTLVLPEYCLHRTMACGGLHAGSSPLSTTKTSRRRSKRKRVYGDAPTRMKRAMGCANSPPHPLPWQGRWLATPPDSSSATPFPSTMESSRLWREWPMKATGPIIPLEGEYQTRSTRRSWQSD